MKLICFSLMNMSNGKYVVCIIIVVYFAVFIFKDFLFEFRCRT